MGTSHSQPGGRSAGAVAPTRALRAELAATNEELRAALAAKDFSESLLLAVVRDAPSPMYAVDREGRLLFWNAACERLFGYASEDVVGERPPHLVSDEATTSFESNLARVFAGETVSGRAGQRHHRDGTVVEVEVIASPLFDADGQVIAAIGLLTDVSERNRAYVALDAAYKALVESEEERSRSEVRYRGIVEDQTELVCRYLPDTTLTFVNAAFAAYYGKTTEELLGTPLLDIFPLSDRDDELARLARFGRGHEVEVQEDWEPRFDGVIRWYHWIDRAFLDDQGNVVEFQSVGHDVHERRQAERSMALQAEILEMVAKGCPLDETLTTIALIAESESNAWRCSVMLVDDEGFLTTKVAPSMPSDFATLVGRVPIELGQGACGTAAASGVTVYAPDVATDPNWTSYMEVANRFGIRSAWSTPMRGNANGSVIGTFAIYGRETGYPLDEHVKFVESLARLAEIAIERKNFEDKLAYESVTDPLTGLPNRTLLIDRLSVALARAERSRSEVAVLFLDLDGFKMVNDSLGHEAGDELLIALSRRLTDVLRPGDTVARFGGDEFVVLCEDLPRSFGRGMATDIADRLFDELAAPFALLGSEVFLRASIGIALSGGARHSTTNELLRDADAAMYRAKELGKGRWVVFDEAMRQRVVEQHATFNALHRALERDELRVYYQPLIDLKTGDCYGAEALVRWEHPERGLLPPGEFVALAEQSDLILHIDQFVLEEAARFAADAPPGTVVSVNLSARHLASPDLVERVAAVIGATDVEPGAICFEITESTVMADADAAVSKIDGLKQLGVKLAIDDFGTGYSSLAYLKRFRVDTVKIDRSFVAELSSDSGDQAIVSAVISMAHALGLNVVAEGIEDRSQLETLRTLGCDSGQGYFFARPLPVADFAALVAAVHPEQHRASA